MFVFPTIRFFYKTREHEILKTNELTDFDANWHSGLRGKGQDVKRQTEDNLQAWQ